MRGCNVSRAKLQHAQVSDTITAQLKLDPARTYLAQARPAPFPTRPERVRFPTSTELRLRDRTALVRYRNEEGR
jgi:hypothetical protein